MGWIAVAALVAVGGTGCRGGTVSEDEGTSKDSATDTSSDASDAADSADSETSVDTGDDKPDYPACSAKGWCWVFPFPQGHDLTAAWASPKGQVWMVGERGSILAYDSDGWEAPASPTTENLYDIWGASEDAIWAVGAGGTIARYDGSAWSLVDKKWQESDTDIDSDTAGPLLLGVGGSSAKDVWACGEMGKLAHFDGTDWAFTPSNTDQTLFDVAMTEPNQGWVVGESTVLSFYGTAWADAAVGASAPWRGLEALSPIDVWVAAANGAIWHFDGAAWSDVSLPSASPVSRIVAEAKGSVWATSTAGALFRKEKDAWSAMQTGTAADLYGATVTPSGVVVTGKGGFAQEWQGGTRRNLNTAMTGTFSTVLAVSTNETWVAGDQVLHRVDGKWSTVDLPSRVSILSMWTDGEDEIWAAGTGGTLLRWQDNAWEPADSQTIQPLRAGYAVRTASATANWVVGDQGVILAQVPGMGWSKIESPTPKALRDIFGTCDGEKCEFWIVGDEGTILRCKTGCERALIEPAGSVASQTTLRAIWGSAANDIWAVGDLGVMLRYDGETWKVVNDKPRAGLFDVWGKSASEVYAAGVDGKVLRYNGKKWGGEDSGTSRILQALHGVGSRVYAVGERGTVLVK